MAEPVNLHINGGEQGKTAGKLVQFIHKFGESNKTCITITLEQEKELYMFFVF